jgi:hypothetical protein
MQDSLLLPRNLYKEINKRGLLIMLSTHVYFAVFYALLRAANAASAVFYPNANLTDTSGNIIQAHGGVIIQNQNATAIGALTWYWFGQDNTLDTDFDGFLGVTCYRSEDMIAWDYLGHALSPVAGTSISNDSVVERPKVLYNAKNNEYVMWFHLDNADYRYNSRFVPQGPSARLSNLRLVLPRWGWPRARVSTAHISSSQSFLLWATKAEI